MQQEALVVRRETYVQAPAAAVFALLTDPEKILRWMGTEAKVQPRARGPYLSTSLGLARARRVPRGGAGASPGYSFGWDGSEVAAGDRAGRDRPRGAAGRNAAAPDPYRPAGAPAMCRPCGRLGALLRAGWLRSRPGATRARTPGMSAPAGSEGFPSRDHRLGPHAPHGNMARPVVHCRSVDERPGAVAA